MWGYASAENSERYNGPFDTREEAIREGFADNPECQFIVVARAEYPDPATFGGYAGDLSDALERMELAADDDCWFNGEAPLFEVKDGLLDEAREALQRLMSEWATKYIATPTAWTARNPETVLREEFDAYQQS